MIVSVDLLSALLAALARPLEAVHLGAGLTLAGVLLLGVILNLLNLEGTLSPWWQWVIRGMFLLAVVVVQGRAQRREDPA